VDQLSSNFCATLEHRRWDKYLSNHLL